MVIDKKLMDEVTERAKASPRLRMNLDLRNKPEDKSQRMLNAIEPDSPEVVHRHVKSSETIAVLRGHLQESLYDECGNVTKVIDLEPGGDNVAINVPIGVWHSARALVSGTVLLTCKDGRWEPLKDEDVLK